jgi:exodeoxyribonuclease V alpha subunit
LNKIKGIKEYTFNLIKDKIISNFCLVELVNEFQGLLSLPMLKKLYAQYPSIQTVRNKMKSDPYDCLCSLARVGFVTADSLLLQIDEQSKKAVSENKPPIIDFGFDLKTSKQRCLSCLLYLLEENENEGNTKMNIVTLKKQCEKLVPACSSYFIECVKDEQIYYNIEKREIGLKSTYNIERYIGERILEGIKENNVWHFETEKYKSLDGINLTDEQFDALNKLCNYNINLLNGNAGTGKTQTTNSIIKMLIDNNKTFELFSPTGKAAKVLAEYTNKSASTIHRGLGYIPPDEWRVNQNNKLNCDVLIIDEFSMTDIFLFKRVLDGIDFNKTKLLMIGDDAQLPSVSCGNLLYDFLLSGIIPTTTLTKVFRYGEGGLMTVATDVRNCVKYLDSKNTNSIIFYGNNKDYAFINSTSRNIVKNTIALYKKLLSQGYYPEDIQVLTA